jgi:hypothetical protein
MPLKYYDVYLKTVGTPAQNYLNDLQQFVNEQFANASNVFTIQEETAFASNTYQNVEVRINHVINTATGINQGDDYKKILFKNLSHPTKPGYMYFFDDNYWIALNTETIKSATSSCIVKRCNNTLRWIDSQGGMHKIPCIIDYRIQENRDYATAGSSFVNPSGVIEVITQFNSEVNLIKPNQEFLIGTPGNWTGYKVVGGGIGNFANNKTLDNTSQGMIRITMTTYQHDTEMDDEVNGISAVNNNVYSVTISDKNLVGTVGGTAQLFASVLFNGNSVSRTLVWSTTNTAIATVNSSGLVSFVAPGSCTIRVALNNNPDVFDTSSTIVSSGATSETKMVVTPSINYVYEGTTQEFDIRLFVNNVLQIYSFSFVLDPGTVPSVNYTFEVVDGHKFRIQNKKFYGADVLTITATSGAYSKEILINLLGVW